MTHPSARKTVSTASISVASKEKASKKGTGGRPKKIKTDAAQGATSDMSQQPPPAQTPASGAGAGETESQRVTTENGIDEKDAEIQRLQGQYILVSSTSLLST